MRRWLVMGALPVCMLTGATLVRAQERATQSSRLEAAPLTLDVFQQRVAANNPELRQVRNDQAQARQLIMAARGAFDPKLSASYSDKRFKDTPYYAVSNVELSVPTYIGTDFKLGFERGVGDKVNPQRYTSSSGLLTLGVSIPLGRDLLTDERRTATARARAVSAIANADVVVATNKLLLSATKAYAEWYLAHRKLILTDSTARLAEFRLTSVRARILAGENAPIDSVEALLEVRRRRVLILEAQNDERTAALQVSSYLWSDRGQGEYLPADAVPVLPADSATATDTTLVATWISDAQRTHPAVLKADGKIALEAADWRLNAQGLLPDIDVTLSAISNGTASDSLLTPSLWDSNYKRSATASTSLLLRKERGKLGASTFKLESARLERDLEQRRVSIDIQNSLNALVILGLTIQLQRENVQSAGLLRDAEEARFSSGESTLLSVNLRERLLLDELVKLEQLRAKILTARVALANARGIPIN